MTDDLITFLRAQLDDDERVALGIDGLSDDTIGDVEHMAGSGAVEYLRRFHLDRVLADLDAKRRVLELYDVSTSRELKPDAWELMKHAVRALALPYADRPGYREEWRP